MGLGLDLGSRSVKAVWLEGGRIAATRLRETVPFLGATVREGRLDLASLDLPAEALAGPVVLTGYGRQSLAGIRTITEIRAHFRGAVHQTGLAEFTLVEIGGQDTKALQVKAGRVFDFQTNDRCAAGTGRYLENMARLLGVDLAELAQAWEEPTRINNTCAIFGESEIIGQVVEGQPLGRIMAGINDSVARRVLQMVKRYRTWPLVLCGGVALNQGVVERLKARLAEAGRPAEVVIPPEPQFNGALGCALEAEALR
jgi:predicted CoA-substrate-specific enzyme activase